MAAEHAVEGADDGIASGALRRRGKQRHERRKHGVDAAADEARNASYAAVDEAREPAHRLARRRDVAEVTQRREPRGFRILAPLDALFHADGEMAADLLVEVTIVGTHRSLEIDRRGVHDSSDRVDQL